MAQNHHAQDANPYGQFSPEGDRYLVSTPLTPRPWTNVVSNGRYGFVVSNSGGGFAWIDDAQHGVISRWHMDLSQDRSGRFLYAMDLDADEVWSLAPAPCFAELDAFACEHATGSTTFRTERAGIAATWRLAVAPADNAEVWTVELTNTTDRPRRLRLCSFLEWCCGVAPDAKREFHRLFITTERDEARHAIIATKNMWDVPDRTPKDHWNRPWPYVVGQAMRGDAITAHHATADKERFFGRRGDAARPAWLTDPSDGGHFGRFVDAACALAGDLELAPNGTTTIQFITAAATDRSELERLLDAPATIADGAEGAWSDRLAPAGAESASREFDLMTSTWLPYQAISARMWARTGYYQQSGAVGFRDQLQDSQVWLPLDPDGCRRQILEHASLQFSSGRVYHWHHRLAGFGSETACSDDYLWLPFITASYIRDTNDTSILEERVAFVDEPRGGTILEHCLRSLDRGWSRRSDRGLPHIGSCDWNDGLSAAGIEGKGESIWLSFFFGEALARFARVCELVGESDRAATLLARRDELLAAANEHGWDGGWYRRATLDSGAWLGSKDCDAGRIYLNPQTWAILTGAAPKDRADACWAAVREHLLGEMGPLLLAPAYAVPDENIGYITRYSPGSRENGGVYTHAAVWALSAACERRDTEAVEQIFQAITPPHASARDPELWASEPYVTPGNIDGPLSDTPGRAGWTWYTGSAAWLHRICLERIGGLRPTWDGLLVDPCPLRAMGQTAVRRLWRGRTVVARYDAAAFAASVAPTITVNGEPRPGGLVSEADAPVGGTVEVGVSWAPAPAPETKPAMAATMERSAP